MIMHQPHGTGLAGMRQALHMCSHFNHHKKFAKDMNRG